MPRLLTAADAICRLRSTLERTVFAPGGGGTWRWQVPIQPIDPLAWIQAQPSPHRCYWQDRDCDAATAGLGLADELVVHGPHPPAEIVWRLRQRLNGDGPGLRYFGGFAFNPLAAPDADWRPFGSARFVLPIVEINRFGEQTTLALNLRLDPADDHRRTTANLLALLEDIAWDVPVKPLAPIATVARDDTPSPQAWDAVIDAALDACQRHTLDKIVLARRSDLVLDASPDPMALLGALRQSSPNAYQFCFQVGDGAAFLGATPELLYARADNVVVSEAIAGTRRRGAHPDEDALLARELLESDKDGREHRHVTRGILDALRPLARSLGAHEPPRLLRLSQVQHLKQTVEGLLHPRVDDGDLLAALHPTPAVGGLPRQEAMRTIGRLEPFDRGWYAGPVGWIGHDCARFAVAIRSGLLAADRMRLYAGAGILPGSTAVSEWHELDAKLMGFQRALTGDGKAPAQAPRLSSLRARKSRLVAG